MKGILFKPDMIRAIREGRKTQTRRLINPQPDPNCSRFIHCDGLWKQIITGLEVPIRVRKPRYLPGETVYVKEAWRQIVGDGLPNDFWIEYRDGERVGWRDNANEMIYPGHETWHSPLFMPKKYARTFLLIKDVSPERLQEITEEDALKEGITKITAYLDVYHWDAQANNYKVHGFATARLAYSILWDSINKAPGTRWFDNPWLWRIEFEVKP